MNKWIGIGRLINNPELKTTANGFSVCSFTVAIDRRFNSGGEKQTDFINCVAWRQTAEFVSKYFSKGKMIALEGTIQVRNWTDNEGKKRYATEAVIDSVEFCGSKEERDVKAKEDTGLGDDFGFVTSGDDDLPF